MRVLIAFALNDNVIAVEVRERLRQHARQLKADMKTPNIATNANVALSMLDEEDYAHCIIHDDLPADDGSSPAFGGGLQLAVQTRARHPKVEITLFYTRQQITDREYAQASSLGASLVRNSEEGLALLLERVIKSEVPPEGTNRIRDITIDLVLNEYRIDSDKVPLGARVGPLSLRPDELALFLYLSHDLEQDDKWKEALATLRGALCGSLIEAHPVFRGALLAALGDEHLASNSCLHFRINENQYDVAFEAIQHPHDKSFWMLLAPVSRSIAGAATKPAPAIFQGPGSPPLRCLLILSDASGVCLLKDENDAILSKRTYQPLPQARDEFRELKALLLEQIPSGRIAVVDAIGSDEAPLTAETLKQKISSQRWDLVHYIGHTDYLEKRGFLILPGSKPGQAAALDLAEIASLLVQTRFVYLSSCKATNLAFVRRLAEYSVPSILGFRSKVKDDLAKDHALYFYERLFTLRSLERAFLQTRKHFHETHPGERLWACSSLVMQR